MGNIASAFKKLFANKTARILFLGLDAAGKTTILYSLKVGEKVQTIPTIGFNLENVKYKKIDFTIWDIGGQDEIRPLWRHYYENTDAVVFVVDSNDTDRVKETNEVLHKMLADDYLSECPVLVLANKQDLPNALQPHELCEGLELRKLRKRDWFIQPCSALTGQGLVEGLDWLSSKI